MYRYAAPQRGRYREHAHISVEALGSEDPALDAEIVQLYDTLLQNLGAREYTLQLNSIGDRECRPAYLEQLEKWLDEHEEVLDADAKQKRATSPLRVFDVKNPAVLEALADAPKIGESLCDACQEHFATVRSLLDEFGVEYELAPTLVRGLDYYTRTTWEFVGPEEGAQSTISGGGRYDYLVEEIGGPPTPGVGFGAGIERLLLAIGDELEAEAPHVDVFFALDEGAPRDRVLELVARLRQSGISTEIDYAGRSIKGQLTQAGRVGAQTIVVVDAHGATIREQGAQDETISLAALPARLMP
jgi:histidyl-tRNA synthetase